MVLSPARYIVRFVCLFLILVVRNYFKNNLGFITTSFLNCNYFLPKRENGLFISAAAAAAKSLQSCPTLCNPIDVSPPGSPVPGILQARTLEWVHIYNILIYLPNLVYI